VRRRPLLTLSAVGLAVVALAAAVLVVVLRGNDDAASGVQGRRDGLVSVQANGSGATVVVSGRLTERSFTVESVVVDGSRVAGRSSDPDQFRATLLDADGRELETIRTWSPLLRLGWSGEGQHRRAVLPERMVQISVPLSPSLESVRLHWPDGRTIARVAVGDVVRDFCAVTPANPAC
jgi:hypothetical protein